MTTTDFIIVAATFVTVVGLVVLASVTTDSKVKKQKRIIKKTN